MITAYLLVSIYITQLTAQPTLTHKLYTTQSECQSVRDQMQSKIKVGTAHTFCMKVKHLSQ